MINLKTITSAATLLFGAFLITSCSSGGGGGGSSNSGGGTTPTTTFDGNTSPAAIDDSNSQAIGEAAGESVQSASSASGLPTGLNISSSINLDEINNIIISAATKSNLAAGIDLSSSICNGGGKAEGSNTLPKDNGEYDYTVTFTDCRYTGTNYDYTMNGTSVSHYDNINDLNSGFYIIYDNFTVVDNLRNYTTTLNYNFTCTSLSDVYSCTYNSDFIGSDGIKHRVTEYSISGDATNGYNGIATFYHGTYGEVSYTASNITYGNCGFLPDGGTISYQSSNGSSGSISFAFDGSNCSVSGTWDNGQGASGSF